MIRILKSILSSKMKTYNRINVVHSSLPSIIIQTFFALHCNKINLIGKMAPPKILELCNCDKLNSEARVSVDLIKFRIKGHKFFHNVCHKCKIRHFNYVKL